MPEPLCKQHSSHPNQEGAALLLVLSVLAATTLLAAHLMLVSELIAREAKVAAITSDLRLQAESAADSAFWMHLTDRNLFTNRTLGEDLESREATSDFEPWMLDRREHLLFENSCQAFLGDAIKPISVTNLQQLKKYIDMDDTDASDAIDTFIDVYNDYIDSDDLVNLYGKEQSDYEEDGYGTLPRNDAMMYRAELYWLDNWQDILTSEVTIIPPRGCSISTTTSSTASTRPSRNSSSSTSTSKPSFFSATEQDFRNAISDLTDAELESIFAARDEWITNSTPLSESLDADLLLTVKNNFSFTESNYAEITTVATDSSGEIRTVRTVTREVNISRGSIFADNAKNAFSIWEIRNE